MVPVRQRDRLDEAPWRSGAAFKLRAAESCGTFHIPNGNIRALRRRSPDPKQRMLRRAPVHRGHAVGHHTAAAAARDGRLESSRRHRPLRGMRERQRRRRGVKLGSVPKLLSLYSRSVNRMHID